ncbi:uncharacterized protein LOC126662078 [Mercurialis annua]|uniref:uncharacterized protein LOC126662078 n=1 Tax=Mercurialis annua TaxID=3986 RepID=UPI00215FFAF1|nr:uncharacterized protein LOC126662078 [Mercurialis annua]
MANFFWSVSLITVFIALLPILTQADVKLINNICNTTMDSGNCRSILNTQLQRKDVEKGIYGLLYISCEYTRNVAQITWSNINYLVRDAGKNPVALMIVKLCQSKYREATESFSVAMNITKHHDSRQAVSHIRNGLEKVNECNQVQHSTLLLNSYQKIVKSTDISFKVASFIAPL